MEILESDTDWPGKKLQYTMRRPCHILDNASEQYELKQRDRIAAVKQGGEIGSMELREKPDFPTAKEWRLGITLTAGLIDAEGGVSGSNCAG